MRKILLTGLLFLAPVLASAQTIPDFPMAFWGTATINGSAAPVGTVIRAYYGSVAAGEATVQESGIYGYTQPTKQKLVTGNGTGEITFRFQRPGESETGGTTAITHAGFVSGETVEKNLAFTVAQPASTGSGGGSPSSSSGSSGSGGSGGSGGGSPTPQVLGASTTAATSTATTTNAASALELARLLQSLFQQIKSLGGSVNPALEATVNSLLGSTPSTLPVRDLKLGMSGEDVRALQTLLISLGHPIPAGATAYFGGQTRTALVSYQKGNGITPAAGYFGAFTRTQMKTKGVPGLWW